MFGFENVGRVGGVVEGVGEVRVRSVGDVEKEDEAGVREFENDEIFKESNNCWYIWIFLCKLSFVSSVIIKRKKNLSEKNLSEKNLKWKMWSKSKKSKAVEKKK